MLKINFSPLFSEVAHEQTCLAVTIFILNSFFFYFSLVETYPSLHFMSRARTHLILKLICSIMKLSEKGKKNIQQSIRFYPLLYNVPSLILLCIHKPQSFPKGIPCLWPIEHVNVQSCLLIIFQYQPISLRFSWLSVDQPIRIDWVLY